MSKWSRSRVKSSVCRGSIANTRSSPVICTVRRRSITTPSRLKWSPPKADPEWCGGVSELVKICHLASVHGVKVVPHGHNLHAALHVVAAQSPAVCPLVEYLLNYMPYKLDFQKDPPTADNGLITLPTRPGFGIEIDEAAIDDMQVMTSLS